MFISPKTAIESGWITHPDCSTYRDWTDRKFVSPNAIDFTLDALYDINCDDHFVISEEHKQMRSSVEQIHTNGTWILDTGVFDGMSSMYVTLPEGVVCELIIRSTLNRNGIFITSGLYDSGFTGNIGFALHNRAGTAFIDNGTRVGQIKFIASDSEGKYAGGYNTEEGQHWNEE